MTSGSNQKRRCHGNCGEWKFQEEFTASEWIRAARKTGPRGKCLRCMQRHTEKLTLKICNGRCGQELPEICFTTNMWHHVGHQKRKCKECTRSLQSTRTDHERPCTGAGDKFVPRCFFSSAQWDSPNKKAVCKFGTTATILQKKNEWRCKAPSCTFKGDKAFFRMWRSTQKYPNHQNGHQKCNTCFLEWTSNAKYDRVWTCKSPGCTFRGVKSFFDMWRTNIPKQRMKGDNRPNRPNGKEICNKCFSERTLAVHARELDMQGVAKEL